ncbi:PepSY-associated TM helix domain-containing protein [Zavarzinia sp. CC-PAN008]|uniref:PepSY-associated TM helix domain-containing protein n=1 Tax=Zavarzinia sp. CC-PAN008 TaxID=3243332 RepID=UPI003F747277
MVELSASGVDARDRAAPSGLYRAVWRWHFYAGLIALPFLILLAVTGAAYLFRDEIDGLVYRDLKTVPIQATAPLAAGDLVGRALAAHPGTALKVVPPAVPGASFEVLVKAADGSRQSVLLNPYDGAVLGTIPDRGSVMWVVRQVHSLAFFGPVANGVIEIVGGWSIMLVATGIYLWWPRRQSGGVLSVRGTPARRVFWRDVHAVTGAVVGVFIAFLALSGMPWSIYWGDQVNAALSGTPMGYPAALYDDVLHSGHGLADVADPVGWTVQNTPVPLSTAAHGSPLSLDQVLARIGALGLAPGYAVALPQDADGVFTATVYPDDLARQRVVHLDQYSGQALVDLSYADYGPVAQAVEWGINVHMGQEFGLANQLFFLAVCVGIVVLAVSAAVMWWKRRPAGRLGVPPLPERRGVMVGLLVILAAFGVAFPLVGLSLVVMLALDLLFTRLWRSPAAKEAWS